MAFLITLAFTGLAITVCYCFFNRNKRFPPGPWGLPFVGNLLSLEPMLHLSFEKWGNQYGPIVGVKLGEYQAVILHDIKTIREALNIHAFSGRPDLKFFLEFSGGKHGISNSDGAEWVEQRRFTLRNLRDFGFGKKSMESMIMDEVTDVIAWIKENDGKAVSVNRKFSLAVVNALLTIMTGKRYDQEDPYVKGILDTSAVAFIEGSKSGFFWFMPTVIKWCPKLLGWDKFQEAMRPVKKFFKDIVDDHIRANHTGNPTDFTYSYLEEIKKTTDSNSSFYKETGISSVKAVLADLFGAGSGTTTVTVAWAILYLLKHPEIQSRLQEELDHVTNKNRAPCLADRPNTPYTEAVIQEVLRFSSMIPFNVLHSTTQEVEFHGYLIPKDTVVISNLHAVHFDVKTWGDPENFRPERFLSDDGKTVKKSESLIPFSVGKRICVGEVLARDQIYLFLTNIFHRFNALPDPKNPNPSLEPHGSFVLEAKPFTVVFQERL